VTKVEQRKEAVMEASKRIAVAGATGRVGCHVVELLEARGHEVVPMSRSTGVDLVTGDGLGDALTGVEVVVDAATGSSPDQEEATRFFRAAARNLVDAGERAGVKRIVLVSIIGIDRFSGGYNAAKVVQEQTLLAGSIPVRILRAAQFHEFVGQFMEWGRQGDVIYVPEMRTQLVAARTVAQALVALATGPESEPRPGEILEIAGPRAERLFEIATLLAARRGDPARIEVVSDPSDPDAELYANGGSLPGPDATLAGPAFEDWLDWGAGDETEKTTAATGSAR
jgi:uncharacterized protein YbjT (DUF2867 family)